MADEKARLRQEARQMRRNLTPARLHEASCAIAAAVLRLPELAGRRVACAFRPLPGEPDPTAIVTALLSRKFRVVAPSPSPAESAAGTFYEAHAAPGPRIKYRSLAIPPDPAGFHVVFVPGLLFDPDGGRLGQGGGYYDRLLASLPASAITIGLALAEHIRSALPREPWDLPVAILVTDQSVYRAAPHSGSANSL